MTTRTKQGLAAVAVGLGWLCLVVPGLWGQHTEVAERGLQVTGSYRLSNIETINTKNGNVMLSVPLASLPPGRGGDPGFGLTLNYNSKLWDLSERYHDDPDAGPNEPQVKLVHKLVRNFANPGWAYSYQYQIVVEDRYDHAFRTLSPNAPCSEPRQIAEQEQAQGHWYRFKLWVVFPDGSARLFRPAGEADYSGYEDDYFQIHPTGWKKLPYSNGYNGANKRHGYRAPASGAVTTYYSVDGSYLRLDFEADDVPYLPADVQCGQASTETTWTDGEIRNWQDNRWTLTFPDGRRVSGTGLMADQMTGRDWKQLEEDDPNDNRTTITIGRYLTDGGDPIDEIRDEVNRTIVVERGSGTGGADQVRWEGRGGTELIWTVHRSETKVWREYDADPDTGSAVNDFVCERLKMVDWIQPPAELGGSSAYRWEFSYNGNSPAAPCDRDMTRPTKPPSNPSPGLGEIATVTLPSGASASYRYAQDIRDASDADGSAAELGEAVLTSARKGTNSAIVRKVVRHDGLAESWDYSIHGTPPGSAPRTLTQSLITAPDGGRVRETYNVDGMLEKVERLKVISGTETVQDVVERYWAYNLPVGIDSGSVATLRANPYVKTEYRTSVTGTGTLSKTAVTTFAYDQNGNLKQVDEYDWVDYDDVARTYGKPTGAAAGTLKRRTVHTYHASGATDAYHKASAPRLKTARKSTEIQNGSGARLSRREFTYGTGNADARTTGNLTEEKIGKSNASGVVPAALTSANSITISHTYDSHGNRLTTTDGRGTVTSRTYGAISGSGSPSISQLYPTQVVEASGTGVARTTDYVYDFNTGAVTSATDSDNNVTTLTELDAMGRPILVKEASGKSEERQTRTWHCDQQRRMIVRSDLSGRAGSGQLVTVTDYDQMGRVSQTRSWESGAPPMPGEGVDRNTHCTAYPADSDSNRRVIKVKNHYEYVNTGSAPGFYTWTSNPYRQTGEGTMGWTRTRADQLGRAVEVGHFSGANRTSASATPTLGKTTTGYNAEYTTVTDAAGKKRRSRLDGLGRLVRVDEPDSNGNLENANGSAVQPTTYTYNALDNLTGVTQIKPADGPASPAVTQTRTFAYDSLSRLTSATNPESGTVRYTYDKNGNLKTRTDARTVRTSYEYDALNRVTQRCYAFSGDSAEDEATAGCNTPGTAPAGVSLETTEVEYAYDNCGSYSEGRLCSVTAKKGAAVLSKTAYANYDALGREGKSTQTTGGTPYEMLYRYDRAGNLVSQTYPSGKVVETVYDEAGRVAGVKRGGHWYAGAAAGDTGAVGYEPHGGIRELRLGNGLWEQRRYNARLQPTQIGLGTVLAIGDTLTATVPNPTAGLLLLGYSYGTTVNNGNVLSQQIRVGSSLNQTQAYTYDELNRLKTATETGSGTGWSRTYGYDRYGNRAVTGAASYLPMVDQALTPRALTSFNASSNRLTGLVAYDGAGNLTRDWGGRNFIYDGDNRMVDFRFTAGGVLTHVKYRYDGDGRRIQKEVVGGRTTTYVYNMMGQLVAEYAGTVPLALRYLTPDHLGSTRVVTAQNLAQNQGVLTRHDYLPFGQEIEPGRGNRSMVSGYTASLTDGPAQKFTGKERDTESRLDYFQARYFSGAAGRFTSVDPALAISLKNPQTWNRYVYVKNRPLTYVDPDGLWPTHIHNQLIAAAFPGLSEAQRRILRRASRTSDFPYSRAKHHPIHYTRNQATSGNEAREDSEWYMHLKEQEARNLQTGDLDDLVQLSPESLVEFGRLLHAVTDRISPAHRQPDGNPAVFEWYSYWWDHKPKEEKISEEEKRRAIHEMHFAFEQVYGRKMLMRALAIRVPTRFVWEEVEVTLVY